MSLEGKVVVITGAGRGIGRAEALLAARAGARIVVNDLGCDGEGRGSDRSVADAVVDEIRRDGGRAVASHDDVAADGAAEALVALALEKFGRIDAAVANAGITRERTLLNTEPDDLDAVLAVHVRASFALTRAAARAMVDRGEGGAILLTSGPGAFFGAARRAALSAAAAAVVAIARSAAVELRKHRIRVNALAPTARTRATEHLPTFQGIRADSMSPEHVAPVTGFLLSDLAADVSGEVLGVAGGRVYAFRTKETTGAFVEGRPFEIAEIRAAWNEITRS
jgi:NAD(P)-dependent dehydrogenase (short-subunit alcohol dehydrogenase family)